MDKSRILRRNQTEAEKKLWALLRNRQLSGVKFRRQFSVGGYILDFYSPEYKLGIEADGGQHYTSEGREKNQIRERDLTKIGIKVIRFTDTEILNNIEGVIEVIQNSLKNRI
ncbi:MAG: endonuclease domain-containing protein [bacterium]